MFCSPCTQHCLHFLQLFNVLFTRYLIFLFILTHTHFTSICFDIKRGKQTVSKIAIGILTILLGFLIVSFFVMVTGKLDGLDYAYYFSYVKLAITLMKYFPQVHIILPFNYKKLLLISLNQI